MRLDLKDLETMLSLVNEGAIVISETGEIEFINSIALDLLKEQQEDLLGKNIKNLWWEDSGDKLSFKELLKELEKIELIETSQIIDLKDENNKVVGAILLFAAFKDSTSIKKKHEILHQAINDVKDIIYATDFEENIIYINQTFSDRYGYQEEEIIGESSLELWVETPEDISKQEFTGENKFYHKSSDGQKFPVTVSRDIIKDQGEQIAKLYIIEDISELLQYQDEMKKKVAIDDLTGTLTRKIGLKFLDKYLKLAQKNSYILSILYLDINNLKVINNKYGVQRGDELIITLSEILADIVNDSDEICRFGEDEFLLILPDYSIDEAKELLTMLRDRLDEFNISEMKPYEISVSAGLAEYQPDDEDSINELIAVAEERMYKDKLKYYSKKNKER